MNDSKLLAAYAHNHATCALMITHTNRHFFTIVHHNKCNIPQHITDYYIYLAAILCNLWPSHIWICAHYYSLIENFQFGFMSHIVQGTQKAAHKTKNNELCIRMSQGFLVRNQFLAMTKPKKLVSWHDFICMRI